MKTPLTTAATVFLTVVIAAWAGADVASAAPKNAEGTEVLVVAGASGEGREGFRPTPGNPVYYIMGKTTLTLGEAVAGIKMPDPAEVERATVATLATQGFIRTQIGGPVPSVYLVLVWGDSNFKNMDEALPPPAPWEAGQTKPPPTIEETMAQTKLTVQDRQKVEQLVGLNRNLPLMPAEIDKLLAAANEDRLYITVAALDIQELRQKKKKLLWRTSMSIDGRTRFADALPVMLASAAPFFGVDSNKPVFVGNAERHKASVEIGEMKVLADEAKAGAEPVRKK